MLRRSEVVLWTHVFDLARLDLGRGYSCAPFPAPGEYISVAVFRPLGRNYVSKGFFLSDPYYDLYINLSRREVTAGGIATSHMRWAHGRFFRLLSTGDARVIASYLVLADRRPRVDGYYSLGPLPVTTVRHTWDVRPVRPVRASYAFFSTSFDADRFDSYIVYRFRPDVYVTEVEVR